MLGSTLGMCLMASANHLLMVFMAVEMASVPSYALAGMLKGRKASSEAALKYAVYGAGAAGIMLYGISLLAGVLGTCHLPSMAAELGRIVGARRLAPAGPSMVLVARRPDAGRRPGIQALGGSVPLLVPRRVRGSGRGGGGVPLGGEQGGRGRARCCGWPSASAWPGVTAGGGGGQCGPRPRPGTSWSTSSALMAAVTCTLGNLAAYGQTNMKRLLAYSTIAHAGYLMMGVAAAVALAGVDAAGMPQGGHGRRLLSRRPTCS